ncbi:MAG: C39 family peptidase [Pseudomonadota bacterium]
MTDEKERYANIFAIEKVPFYDQTTLSNWDQKGFISVEEAMTWHKKACGATCVKMIVEAFKGENLPLGEIIRDAVKDDSYKAGLGWVHQPLATFISKRFDLVATAHRQISTDRIKTALTEGALVIASVGLGFKEKKNGHLIVVLGCELKDGEVSGFYVHHPSTDKELCWVKKHIPIQDFANAFSSNIIEVKNLKHFNG